MRFGAALAPLFLAGLVAAAPPGAPSAPPRSASPPPGPVPSARPAPPPPSPAPSPTTALGLVAARLAADLSAAAKDATVFVSPLRSDEPSPRGDALSSKLGLALAGAIGGRAAARPEPVPLATAQALARGAGTLVYVQLEIARGQLRASADTFRAVQNVWDRVRQPSPAPLAHAFASAPIDGEIRSYLAPVPLIAKAVQRVAADEREIVALACGDVDDDGSLEIVTLSRRRVAIGRARGGRFVPFKTALLRDLASVAPAPLREPLAGLAIVRARGARLPHIDAGISDRAHGSRLDGELHPLAPIAGVPFATLSGDACVRFQGSTLMAAVAPCAEGDPPPDFAGLELPIDVAAAGVFVTAAGAARAIAAARDPRTAELRVVSAGQTAVLARAGAQVALADLDQDGAPEIISTLDVPAGNAAASPSGAASSGATDALVITTWQPGGPLVERARTEVPSGVRAVAACPSEGGVAPIVLATLGELWLIR